MHRWFCCSLLSLLILPVSANAYSFKPGDELWSRRKVGKLTFHHAGVYVGNGKVVHVNADPGESALRLLKGKHFVFVEKASMGRFSKGKPIKVGPTRPRFSRAEIVKRALAQIGKQFRWTPLGNNCQHFSSKIVSGRSRSPEANTIKKVLKAAAQLALKKTGQLFSGKNNTRARLKNCSKKKIYVCVYNGGDKVYAAAKKIFSLHPGKTQSIQCASNGKNRCKVKLSKSRRCSLLHKAYSVSKNSLRYLRSSKRKFKVSTSCR